MKFKVGRDNLALTVFIPQDCGNNCPFCTSKEEYRTCPPDISAVLTSIQKFIDARVKIPDIVITGGEPFANLDVFKKVLNKVIRIQHNHIYVNTTFPYENREEILSFLRSDSYITGINISRHINDVFSERVSGRLTLKRIRKPVRINCVIGDDTTDDEIKNFVNQYHEIGEINFRADYTTITPESLHSFSHPLFIKLDEIYGYVRKSMCNVCDSCNFRYRDHGLAHGIHLHRGVENSHIEFGRWTEINDIIIKQDGEIRYDWKPEYKLLDSDFDNLILTLSSRFMATSYGTRNCGEALEPRLSGSSGCGRASGSSCGYIIEGLTCGTPSLC